MSPLATLQTAEAAGRRLIADAKREHRDAQALKAALEERVRAGDTGVKPGELGEAAALVEHTQLRIEAAQRQADQAVVDARHQAYREVGQAAIAFATADDPPILDAYRAAVDALTVLVQATTERSTALREIAAAAEPLVVYARNNGEQPLLAAAGIRNAGMSQGLGQPASITVATATGAHRTADAEPWRVAFAALSAVLEDLAARTGDRPWVWEHQTDLGPLTAAAWHAFPEMAPTARPGVTVRSA